MSNAIRTLLIKQEDGSEIQIDIPETWKVTFGPAHIGETVKSSSSGKVSMALRVYESEKMQRAVFTNVLWFRDMSIPVRVKKINVQEKEGYMEVDGAKKKTIFQAKTSVWVDPDNEEGQSQDFPQLKAPSDQEMFGGESLE